MVGVEMGGIVIGDDVVREWGVGGVVFEGGDDIEEVMRLCEGDMSWKNMEGKERFVKNLEVVGEKVKELEEGEGMGKLEGGVRGEEIMKRLNVRGWEEVGGLKSGMKDGILEGVIGNEYEGGGGFMVEGGEKMGVK